MKVVHAIWEKRNMGIDAWEIEIEQGDSYDELTNQLDSIDADYIVVKVPSFMANLNYDLFNSKLWYIENIISLHRNTEIPVLSKMQQRIADQMSYAKMESNNEELLFDEIRRGMFSTDRISFDPHFSKEQVSERYIGMILDEKKMGADLYVIKYKNRDVGFFIQRVKDNNVMYASLSGIYPDAGVMGIGFSMIYYEIVEAQRVGCKRILGSISTNNVPSLNISLDFGYSIDKVSSVFVKHKGD